MAEGGIVQNTDAGVRLFHVVWQPGTQNLLGECWCGRIRDSADPISLWDWMDGHRHLGFQDAAPEPEAPDAAVVSR
jgi:hypothetical protein